MIVKLTYFKSTGKYYSEGEYKTEKIALWEIFKEVREKMFGGCLPGLCKGTCDFIVSIDVPEHEQEVYIR